jgi:2-polyprenyl-3-methyl-5-hydroxy-6-metoxy-1,4-benzoquinol methylase
MPSINENRTSDPVVKGLYEKNINLIRYILYGLMILVSLIIWILLYDARMDSNKANLLNAIFTTLIANGLVGLMCTLVLNKEKDKALDATIKRVIRTDFLNEYFVAEKISESLERGFAYCNNTVKIFRVYAVSTNHIVPFIEKGKTIDNCHLMVRGYGENMSRDEIESDNEIKMNIKSWKALEQKCIKELKYVRYNNYSLNYYCIFDSKFITFGQYIVDEKRRINKHKVDPLQPFSITDKTEVGKKIIENFKKQFDSYFNSEKKKYINFDEFASRYDDLRKADNELISTLIKECDIRKNGKILDFGCGTGNYIKKFQEQGFNNIFGLDTSEDMREMAFYKTGATIYEQFSDVSEIFDIILIIDVMHFIKDTYSLAQKLHSKCTDEAVIAIVTQSNEQIKNRGYNEFFPSAKKIDLKRYHDIGTLIKDFERASFSLQKKIIFKGNTTRKFNLAFLDKVRKKCFSMFELIDENEFNSGIKKFEEALAKNNNVIKESYAGKTILLFSKTKALPASSIEHPSNIISTFREFFC